MRTFVTPQGWAIKLCALPKEKSKCADSFFLHMQLAGVLIFLLGSVSGFLITPSAFWLGIFGSLILARVVPSRIMRDWPQA